MAAPEDMVNICKNNWICFCDSSGRDSPASRKDCDPNSFKDMTLHIFPAQCCAALHHELFIFGGDGVQSDI